MVVVFFTLSQKPSGATPILTRTSLGTTGVVDTSSLNLPEWAPPTEQIEALMRRLPPTQRDRPWSMEELRLRLKGKFEEPPSYAYWSGFTYPRVASEA